MEDLGDVTPMIWSHLRAPIFAFSSEFSPSIRPVHSRLFYILVGGGGNNKKKREASFPSHKYNNRFGKEIVPPPLVLLATPCPFFLPRLE